MNYIVTGSTSGGYYNPFSSQKPSTSMTATIFASGTTTTWETEKERFERERKEIRKLREKKLNRIFNGKKDKQGGSSEEMGTDT